ncbi:MAG: hypothetical protein ACI4U3_10395 [Traorella sp.]
MKKKVIILFSIIIIVGIVYFLGNSIVASQEGIHSYFHKTFFSVDDRGYIIDPLENKVVGEKQVFMEGELNQLKNKFKGKVEIEDFNVNGNTDLEYATFGKDMIYYIGLDYNENTSFSEYRYLIVVDGQDLMFIVHTSDINDNTILVYTKDGDHILDVYERLLEVYKTYTFTME